LKDSITGASGALTARYLKPTYEGLKGISYLKRDLFQFDLKPTYEGLKVGRKKRLIRLIDAFKAYL